MKLKRFPECNYPRSGREGTPAYVDDANEVVIIRWSLSWWERLLALFTGSVWHRLEGRGYPLGNISMTVKKPIL